MVSSNGMLRYVSVNLLLLHNQTSDKLSIRDVISESSSVIVVLHNTQVSCLSLFLFYIYPVAYPYISSSTFGAGSGPIFLSGLNCVGNEQTLLECSTSSFPYYYTHSSDAGVQCEQRQHSGNTVYLNYSKLLYKGITA